ncbi:F-box protein At5g49610-like [Salvia miltiorrhiza]|uniref:F-box protein At5g49610-like n=1 Tax=Salvia miltiorrhiza TaxID=226208 RepID=UPI0025AC88FA|nr:F-box protein At5g49610-like [Salvia miltiorrhiza]
MDPIPSNNDVVTEILLHLPTKSLLRFRAVCKSWRDSIDSRAFRKSHTQQHEEEEDDDDTALLQFSFHRDRVSQLSMMFPPNGSSYNNFPALAEFFDDHLKPAVTLTETGREVTERGSFVRIVGPVNGLICIHHRNSNGPIAVCNPSLGKINILPVSPACSFHQNHRRTIDRDVGIGFDEAAQDYKVVQVLSCRGHRGFHASVYSRATDSWRELGRGGVIDHDQLYIRSPIKSSRKNGSFSHWLAIRKVGGDEYEHEMVSLDVKNEVFRMLEMPDYESLNWFVHGDIKIFAKGDDSFVLFNYCVIDMNNWKAPKWLKIFGSRIEEDTLRWDVMTSIGPFCSGVIPMALWKTDCVVLKDFSKRKKELIIYDYCAKEFVGRFEMKTCDSEIFEYRGSIALP